MSDNAPPTDQEAAEPAAAEPAASGPRRRAIRRKPEEAAAPDALSGPKLSLTRPLRFIPTLPPMKGDPLTRPFLICIGAGLVAALIGDFTGFDLLSLLGPFVATIAYPLWGMAQRVHLRPQLRERFADNAYYIGFIFTQLSLVVGFGLPVLRGMAIESSDVMRAFGIAIGTSMAGLVARTLLVQTGHTVTENEDIVEQEVEGLAREVEALAQGVTAKTRGMLEDLDGIATTLSASRQALTTQLGDWVNGASATLRSYDELLRGQAAAVATSTEAVSAAANRAQQGIQQGQSDLVVRIQEAATALQALQAGLHNEVALASQSIQATSRDFAAGVDTMKRAQEGMGEQLQEAVVGVRAASQTLTRGAAALQGLSSMEGMVGALGERVARVDGQLVGLQDTVGRTTVNVGQAAEGVVASVKEAGDAARLRAEDRAKAFTQEMEAAVDALDDVLKAFRGELERLRV